MVLIIPIVLLPLGLLLLSVYTLVEPSAVTIAFILSNSFRLFLLLSFFILFGTLIRARFASTLAVTEDRKSSEGNESRTNLVLANRNKKLYLYN